jgi:HPt (histidine-containing phosphotransfer) domain-containing protein
MALTANALSGMREMYIENGFSDFLAKPVEMPKLNGLLSMWIAPDKQEESATELVAADNSYEVLEVFLQDAKKKLVELPRCLDSGNIKLFATYVHALKSASANVKEIKLSEMAANLESAAKKDNVLYVKENINAFFDELRNVIDRIAAIVAGRAAAGDCDEIPAQDLAEKLAQLKTALIEIDISAIDEIIAQIGSNACMKEIAGCILVSDYDGAVNAVEKILQQP